MKLFKRIISVISVAAMLSTTITMFSAQAEAVQPKLQLDVVYDETTKEGDMTVSILNLCADDSLDTAYLSLEGLQVSLAFDSSEFDTSLYSSSGKKKPIDTNVTASATDNASPASGFTRTFTEDNSEGGKDYISFAYAGYPSTGFYDDEDATPETSIFTKFEVGKIHFKLLGDSATVTALKRESNVDLLNDNWSDDEIVKRYIYGNTNLSEADWIVEPCVIGSVATPTPTPTATATATPTPTPTPTPAPVTFDSGVSVFNDENDAAAWAWKTAPAEGTKLAVTLKVNGEEQAPKTFDLKAKVEATVKVGIIVQYDPSVYELEIVNVDVQ